MSEHRRAAARDARAPLRRVGAIGLLITAPLALILTLWPNHLLLPTKPRVVRGLEWLHRHDLFEWLYWTRLEVLANVAMLVPIALLLAFLLGTRRWWLALLICIAASGSVELAQHFMPGRVSSMRDVLANSVGALLGALLAVGIQAAVIASRRAATQRDAKRWRPVNG